MTVRIGRRLRYALWREVLSFTHDLVTIRNIVFDLLGIHHR